MHMHLHTPTHTLIYLMLQMHAYARVHVCAEVACCAHRSPKARVPIDILTLAPHSMVRSVLVHWVAVGVHA